MSTENDLEKIFKKLNSVSSDVPDEMWPAILAKMQRRRRVIIIFFVLACLFLFSGTIFLLQPGKNKSDEAIHKQSSTITAMDSAKTTTKSLNEQPIRTSIENTKETIHSIDLKNKKSPVNSKTVLNDRQSNVTMQSNTLTNPASPDAPLANSFEKNQLQSSATQKKKDTQNLNSNKKQKNNSSNNDETEITSPQKESTNDEDPISISIFASPDFPFQKINYIDSLIFLNSTKSFMHLSFTIGTRVQYQINKNFSASLGVQYSQVNDKIKMSSGTIKSHYKTFDLPLLVGYDLPQKNFSAGINAGIILNMTASRTSNTTSVSPYPYYFQTDETYKKSVGLSYYAGLNFTFNQTKKINFFVEPYFKYRPSNIAKPSASFQQKINTAGIMIGVNFNFFKKNNADSSSQ